MSATDVRQPQLRMTRTGLTGLPGISLPEGVSGRSFEEGDEARWECVLQESFGGAPGRFSFDAIMRSSPSFQPERVWFLMVDGEAVATAAAYPQDWVGPTGSTLHYVAVRPAHQGRRLGYWVSLLALHRMVIEQRSFVGLATDDFRLPAIHTYLKLGFEPYLVHENQRARWPRVFDELGAPELTRRFAAQLEDEIDVPPSR
ncbi:MAG: GNAT family N-acetyltransferase [Lentisphaerae bacterium]|nr:GNAT family N-acetyltransferase [Lentisphaerota bacterium]MBT4815346.1 GNAT family N-acetyltransferase [Lentisphaerota bacterium]MBT5608891.1 GNAT family N-acetyltransferase [Lentisphaerota bacterium]MBT7057397.1 GNAT family N-acetyltransferase [Lentisphaerota bacterium]MBT7842757.1 GNAT family N-acetyltransferase [Lentisphaerota bacterium]